MEKERGDVKHHCATKKRSEELLLCVCEKSSVPSYVGSYNTLIPNYKKHQKKRGNFYYLDEEIPIFKDIKKILRLKKLRKKHKKCTCPCIADKERKPDKNCIIRIEIFAEHDKIDCIGTKVGGSIGTLIYPVCKYNVLSEPGVPLRRSLKHFRINEKCVFYNSMVEQRKYAYDVPVLQEEALNRLSDYPTCICPD